MAAHLLVLGYASGASWVLHEQRMGFGPRSQGGTLAVEPGDVCFPYVTKNCWGYRGRQRRVLIGRAVVLTPARPLPGEVRLGEGRRIESVCELFFENLAPYGEGVPLAPLAEALSVFRDSPHWTNKLRRPVLRLTDEDAGTITAALTGLSSSYEDAIGTYPECH